MNKSRCKTYASCYQHGCMDADQVRAEENKRLIQYRKMLSTWFERSPVPKKWWQFWKPTLMDGMTWGPWVRSPRKFKKPDPPPPPPPEGETYVGDLRRRG